MPYKAAEKQMEWLKNNEEFDLIVWSGDSSGHDIDKIGVEEAVNTMANLTDLINLYFPEVPMIPVLGNHDFPIPSYQEFKKVKDPHLLETA